MGVEALANYYLINTNTSLSNKVKNDTAGKKNPGDNVYTTLDVKIQQVANDQLDIYRGAIIVTEVSTGKILAMVSHPDFDPNSIGEIWEDLVDNDSSTVLVNRATQGLYLIPATELFAWAIARSAVITAPVMGRWILPDLLQNPVIRPSLISE